MYWQTLALRYFNDAHMSVLCLMVHYLLKSIILNKGNRSDVIFRTELLLPNSHKKLRLYFAYTIIASKFQCLEACFVLQNIFYYSIFYKMISN